MSEQKREAWLAAIRTIYRSGDVGAEIVKLSKDDDRLAGDRNAWSDAFVARISQTGEVVFVPQFALREELTWHKKLREELFDEQRNEQNLLVNATYQFSGIEWDILRINVFSIN